MNQSPFGIQKLPTTEELWKNEKSKYRIWIISFGVGILAILAMVLISSILSFVAKSARVDELWKEFQEIYNTTDTGRYTIEKLKEMAERQVLYSNLVWPSIKLIVVTLAVTMYFTTVYRSYNLKSFAGISSFSTGIFFMFALWEFINLFSYVFGIIKKDVTTTYTSSDWISVVTPFLFVAIYMGFGTKVTRIRNTFKYSERMNDLKNNPILTGNIDQFMNQFNNTQQNSTKTQGEGQGVENPFGPPAANVANENVAFQINEAHQQERVKSEEELKYEKLSKLSKSQLEEIAKKLSISGFETMSSEELIKTIIRMTKSSK